MCRHLAYVGPPATLADVVATPPYGLLRQSWAPRRQQHGTMNVDGFGVGWYAADDPTPARYRRAVPIWADRSFADLARVTSSTAVLASVRSATAQTAPDESAAAPFAQGRWLFSHNGAVDGWPGSIDGLARSLPVERLLDLEARVDSALLWALVLDRLEGGWEPVDALADVVVRVRAATTARVNLLLTDGRTVVATRAGDTLFWRRDDRGTLVVSEPLDDASGWVEVPEWSVLTATTASVDVAPLPDPPRRGAAPPTETDPAPGGPRR